MTINPNDPDMVIGIIGAGAMGRGIAQVAITGGCRVKLFDTHPEALEEALRFISQMLSRAVQKNRMEKADADAATNRLELVASMSAFSDCTVVIEAAVEKLEIKRDIFGELEDIIAKDAVIASNTSSLSITTLASYCRHPERFAGMHFFNPVPLMKLVEVIDGLRTAPESSEFLMGLGKRLGRVPVRVKDAPGFLVNQVGRGYNIEAAHIASEGIASFADMDRIMRDAAGFRMGPFELMDLTGLDVTHPATQLIYEQFYHEPRFRPSQLMNTRREAELLGRKSGTGFYHYEDGKPQIPDELPAPPYDGQALWISKDDMACHDLIVRFLKGIDEDIKIDGGDTPDVTSICLVTPFGFDATHACVEQHLNPEQTLAIDCLFGLEGRITLMKTPLTKKHITDSAHGLFAGSGTSVTVINDCNGFVSQRHLAMIVNIGCAVAQSQIASPHDIDRAVTLGLGYPKGPLDFGDHLGVQRIFEILHNMHSQTGDPRYRPTPWLRRRAQLQASLLLQGT